nr:MAG TPA: hypothetical protein [Caudoviricetes sp.]
MLSAYRARPAGSWLLLDFPRRRLAVFAVTRKKTSRH